MMEELGAHILGIKKVNLDVNKFHLTRKVQFIYF
jgi:hypothetical protein